MGPWPHSVWGENPPHRTYTARVWRPLIRRQLLLTTEGEAGC